jgi:cobalt/nickel transport system permease protein
MKGCAATRDIGGKAREIHSLEQLSAGKTVIHRLHPAAKLAAAFVFIVTVISFNRYAPGRLTPFLFYPCIVMAMADIPVPLLLKRTAIALPFCLFAGVSNVVFNREPAFAIGALRVSYGAVSLFTLLLRTALCVAAVLILAASTPIMALCGQLRRFHIPAVLVMTLGMAYRYIGVLLTEAAGMYTAYALRSGKNTARFKGVRLRDIGSFLGCLLLRGFDRAERVYAAMNCRGYTLRAPPPPKRQLLPGDWLFLSAVCLPCVFLRFVNLSSLFSQWARGWGV